MPGIGGYETCRRIRAHPSLRHIKIIMVSARALVAERLCKGMRPGPTTISPSPLMKKELVAKCGSTCASGPLRKWSNSRQNVLTLLRHETRTPLNGMLTPQMLRAEAEMAERTGHAPGHGVRGAWPCITS